MKLHIRHIVHNLPSLIAYICISTFFHKPKTKHIPTCKSIDALAHRTALLTAGNPLVKERFEPINLSGDEFTRIVTSSIPSFPIIDHPSSLNPLRASLKPLPKLH
jgi:hypothetical protein